MSAWDPEIARKRQQELAADQRRQALGTPYDGIYVSKPKVKAYSSGRTFREHVANLSDDTVRAIRITIQGIATLGGLIATLFFMSSITW